MKEEKSLTRLLLLKEKFFNYVNCGDQENAKKVLQLIREEYKKNTGHDLNEVLSKEEIDTIEKVIQSSNKSEEIEKE